MCTLQLFFHNCTLNTQEKSANRIVSKVVHTCECINNCQGCKVVSLLNTTMDCFVKFAWEMEFVLGKNDQMSN